MRNSLLSLRDLSVECRRGGRLIKTVDRVSFDLAARSTLAIVGESGAGKSMMTAAIPRLLPAAARIVSGEVWFQGRNATALDEQSLRALRGKDIGMIFQDPNSALTPFLTISEQISEVTRRHLGYSRYLARQHALAMLELARITNARERLDAYPHELSGGLRQRVMIAIALACQPKLLIADEPTTALDATVQAPILKLLKELATGADMTTILVSHDLSVVSKLADHVAIMYRGRILEKGPERSVRCNPQHPYTRLLLASIPVPSRRKQELACVPGAGHASPPTDTDLCPFLDRCGEAVESCRQQPPPWHSHDGNHYSLCWVR